MPGVSSRRFALLAVVAAGIATGSAGGCSRDMFEYRACSVDAHCRNEFGFGAICGDKGFCTGARPSARCASTYPEDLFAAPDQHRHRIVFASLMDRSSDAHVTRERAIRLAVKGANDAGGLDGRRFGLVMCDIRQDAALDSQPRTAAAVASARFVADALGVPAIIGPSASTDAEQVWDAVRDLGTLVVSPAATSPALTALELNTSDDVPGLLWRTAPSDALQGRVIAEDMLARKVMRAHVIRETGSYGEGLASVFAEHYRAGGGFLALASVAGEDQIAAAVAALPADDPAELLFVSSQQNWIVRFLKAAGSHPAHAERAVFLTDAAANESVISEAASAAGLFPRVRGTRPAPRDPNEYVLASFTADFRAEYGGATPATTTFSAHAYDAAWLALYGSAWAQLRERAITGAGIARGLRRLSMGAPLDVRPSSWALVTAAFRAGRGVDVRGASGDLDFHPVTRDLAGPIEIWTIGQHAGRFTMVRVDTRTPPVQ